MSSNTVIGIGGSGTRCIESLIHLCAAGLGPNELHVLFVDPDRSNGNLKNTLRILKDYNSVRGFLGDKANKIGLFKTNITFSEQNTWNIFENQNECLESYINMDTLTANMASLVKVFFSKEELKTKLNEGFRGHPAIGAVVMAELNKNIDPWLTFWDRIRSSQSEFGAKVFLFGSIFGGTGAAGFPTLAKLIKSDADSIINDEQNKILLGGALLLPYFGFDPPTEDDKKSMAERDDQMFVSTDNFSLAAKAALQYYQLKDIGIDEYYLVGDVIDRSVGKFSVGNEKQNNEAHFVELISALGAIDFINSERKPNDHQSRYFLAGRDDNSAINWDYFPITRDFNTKDDNRRNMKVRMVCATTTFHTIKNYISFNMEQKYFDRKLSWYRENFVDDDIDVFSDVVRDKMKKTNEYIHEFFRWCTEISREGSAKTVELFNAKKLVDENWQDKYAITNLLAGSSSQENSDHFVGLMNTEENLDKVNTDALSRIFDLVHKTSQRFCNDIYKFQ